MTAAVRFSRGGMALLALATLVCVGCRLNESRQGPPDEPLRPVLIAASNMMHPPFSYWDGQQRAAGLEVDLVEAAAAALGQRVRWVERPFPELLTALESGEADFAVSTIGITEERSLRVAFSDSYFETQIVALVRNNAAAPRTLAELSQKRIGANEATTSYTAARRRWPNAQIVGAAVEGSSWLQMVQEGLVDAFVVDASDQSRLEQIAGIELRRLDEPLAAEYFGVAMQQGASDKVAAVNRAIAEQRRVRALGPTHD